MPPRYADAYDGRTGCAFDGMPAACDVMMDWLDTGSPMRVVTTSRPRQIDSPLPSMPGPGGGASSVYASAYASGGSWRAWSGITLPGEFVTVTAPRDDAIISVGGIIAEGLFFDSTSRRPNTSRAQDASIRSTNDWDRLRWKGVPLSPCATKILGDVFAGTELDVGKLRIRIGIPRTILEFASVTPGAVTIGYTIYIASGSEDRFDVSTIDGMARLAHEAWHSLQAVRVGGETAFKALYLDEALSLMVMGKDPYRDNHYEYSAAFGAYPAETEIRQYLEERYKSKRPCDEEGLSPKIQTRR